MFKNLFEEINDLIGEFLKKEESWLVLLFAAGVVTIPFFVVENLSALLLGFITSTWWLWTFFILLPIFRDLELHVRQTNFESKITWVLLELHMPREIEKSPRAMEQTLIAIYTLRNAPGNWIEKYIEGEVTRWFSLELVSFSGEIRFFARTPERHRNAVEAAFFSYYPDIEITEAEDYTNQFPRDIIEVDERGLDIYGSELVLTKSPAYPIKTYPNFEEPEEARQVDPMASMLEMMSKVKKGEIVCLQILIAPAGSDWVEEAKKELEKLQTPAVAEVGTSEAKKLTPIIRSPGKTAILEAVERNISKPAFNTLIRVFYVAPKEVYAREYVDKGIVGTFNQYGTLNLNMFRKNHVAQSSIKKTQSLLNRIFYKTRVQYRRNRFLYNFRRREVPPETMIGRIFTSYFFNYNFGSRWSVLNIEGLATIFHPPTSFVLTAPHMKRMESKKAGPSAGLSIFGDEEEIEKFK